MDLGFWLSNGQQYSFLLTGYLQRVLKGLAGAQVEVEGTLLTVE